MPAFWFLNCRPRSQRRERHCLLATSILPRLRSRPRVAGKVRPSSAASQQL